MKFKKLTPNLVVSDVEASMKFYQTVFGFQTGFAAPDQPPYVFGSVVSGLAAGEGGVEIFFNEKNASKRSIPRWSPGQLVELSRCMSRWKGWKRSSPLSREAERKSPCH